MSKIGILAYGSLIEDPGEELKPLISERVPNVKTPFTIEFARSSSSRNGAPTVIPVENGGMAVNAVILIFQDGVTIEKAKDLLWRRETRNETSNKHYSNPTNPTKNQVVVAEVNNLEGVEVVLYTKIGSNIDSLTPKKLATLAIESAKAKAGDDAKDGISYLLSLKRQKITTPLMGQYEEEVIKLAGASSLPEALKMIRKNV